MSELQTSEVYQPQADLGTPAPISIGKLINVEVDGQSIAVEQGTQNVAKSSFWPGDRF